MEYSWNGFDISGLNHAPGLENSHNDCFMNSVLQFVFNTPQLVRYISWKKRKCNKCKNCNECIFCILSVYLMMISEKKPTIDPSEMCDLVNRLFPARVPDKQEDAHEMLTFLLDQLSSPTPTVNGQKLWVQPTNSGKTLQSNPINILFCGTMKSNFRCVSCGDMHINTENFQEFNLNLNLKPPNNSRLEDYIAAYFKTELLESFKCQHCGKKCTFRKLVIDTQSNLLIIQLKRFQHDGTKICTDIDIPLDLNLDEYSIRRVGDKPAEYKLYGFISHAGIGLENGHYTTTMIGYDLNWYHYDDTLVKPTEPDSSRRSQPYILFYYKVHVENKKTQTELTMKQRRELEAVILNESREIEINNLKSESLETTAVETTSQDLNENRKAVKRKLSSSPTTVKLKSCPSSNGVTWRLRGTGSTSTTPLRPLDDKKNLPPNSDPSFTKHQFKHRESTTN